MNELLQLMEFMLKYYIRTVDYLGLESQLAMLVSSQTLDVLNQVVVQILVVNVLMLEVSCFMQNQLTQFLLLKNVRHLKKSIMGNVPQQEEQQLWEDLLET